METFYQTLSVHAISTQVLNIHGMKRQGWNCIQARINRKINQSTSKYVEIGNRLQFIPQLNQLHENLQVANGPLPWSILKHEENWKGSRKLQKKLKPYVRIWRKPPKPL